MARNNLLGIPSGLPGTSKDIAVLYGTLTGTSGYGSLASCTIRTYLYSKYCGNFNILRSTVHGDAIQIQDDGLYFVFRSDRGGVAAGDQVGISVNATPGEQTGSINAASEEHRLIRYITPGQANADDGWKICIPWFFKAGDLIRAHDEANTSCTGTSNYNRLIVARIS